MSDDQKTCANCAKPVGGEDQPKAQRCTRCQAKWYCSAECQRGDWKFHKRVCESVADKRQRDEEKSRQDEKRPSGAGSAPRPKGNDVVVDDDEDIGDWYRHRETKLPTCPQSAPKKIESETGIIRTASEGASAWNTAGTWEEKDVTARATELLKTLLESIALDGGDRKLGNCAVTGEVHQCAVRGRRKFMWELKVSAEVQTVDHEKKGRMKIDEFSGVEELVEQHIELRGVTDRSHAKKAIAEELAKFPQHLESL